MASIFKWLRLILGFAAVVLSCYLVLVIVPKGQVLHELDTALGTLTKANK